MKIIKRGGEAELFDSRKLCNSIVLAGAKQEIAEGVCEIVHTSIDSGITTEKIFTKTREHLMKIDPDLAAIYSLDRGLSALGPSGFMFEQYVASMLRELGYEVLTNYFAQGEVVHHEVDVLAMKGNIVYFIEAKYRNDSDMKTHIDQVIYADARLEDIKRRAKTDGDTREYYGWVVTNTTFTEHSQDYIQKRDLQLLGWDYPIYINLKKISREKKMYPVTVLPSITKPVLKQCSVHGYILVLHLKNFTVDDFHKKLGVSMRLSKKLHEELRGLLGTL